MDSVRTLAQQIKDSVSYYCDNEAEILVSKAFSEEGATISQQVSGTMDPYGTQYWHLDSKVLDRDVENN